MTDRLEVKVEELSVHLAPGAVVPNRLEICQLNAMITITMYSMTFCDHLLQFSNHRMKAMMIKITLDLMNFSNHKFQVSNNRMKAMMRLALKHDL